MRAMETIASLFRILIMILQVGVYIIIAQAILSWLLAFNVLNMSSPIVRQIADGLDRITAPIYRPIRRIMPNFGGLDLSPMVVILILIALQMLLSGIAKDIANSAASATDMTA